MIHQPCLDGKHVKINMVEEKRIEAEGVSSNPVCMVLFSFFFGYKLAPEEGKRRTILTVSWLWAAISGPLAGIQAAAAQEETVFMVRNHF